MCRFCTVSSDQTTSAEQISRTFRMIRISRIVQTFLISLIFPNRSIGLFRQSSSTNLRRFYSNLDIRFCSSLQMCSAVFGANPSCLALTLDFLCSTSAQGHPAPGCSGRRTWLGTREGGGILILLYYCLRPKHKPKLARSKLENGLYTDVGYSKKSWVSTSGLLVF